MKETERRIYLIEEGYFKEYLQKRRIAFKNGYDLIDQNGDLNEDYFEMSLNDCKICERIRRSSKEQRQKVEEHIKFLFNKNHYDLFFVTFTFSDPILKETKPETRKQKIRRLLTDLEDYILNIDYGAKTEREHYHAIIAVKKGSYEIRSEDGHIKLSILDKYNLGNYDVKKIGSREIDSKKLSRYISKLTLHSVKIRQNYISVKKGSEYQEWKKTIKNIRNVARTGIRTGKQIGLDDLYDQMTAYEY